jgi:ribosome-binding protein aMBF1 (putative translation factor)
VKTATRNYRTNPLSFQVALANLERQMADHLKRQGVRLRDARRALKISQEEAARLIGVSNKAYGDWERGKSEPRDRNWRQIEEILKIKAEEVRGEPPQSQLDRIEETQQQILGELAAIRLALAAPSRRQKQPQRQSREGTAASGS